MNASQNLACPKTFYRPVRSLQQEAHANLGPSAAHAASALRMESAAARNCRNSTLITALNLHAATRPASCNPDTPADVRLRECGSGDAAPASGRAQGQRQRGDLRRILDVDCKSTSHLRESARSGQSACYLARSPCRPTGLTPRPASWAYILEWFTISSLPHKTMFPGGT